MSSKREQRLRRKARAALRTVELERDRARKLEPVAIAAIRYVGEIDAPRLTEAYAIANRRDDLVRVVHAHQGRAERTRRDPQVVRQAEVVPVVEMAKPAERPVSRFPTQPLPRRQTQKRGGCDALVRDIELKRRELELAAKRFGAEANKRAGRDALRVARLASELECAGRALVRAEKRLADAVKEAA